MNDCSTIGAKSLVAAAQQRAGTRVACCWHGSCCPSGAGACMPPACCVQPLSIQPSASVPWLPSSAGREEVCACDLHRLRRPAFPPQRLLGALGGLAQHCRLQWKVSRCREGRDIKQCTRRLQGVLSTKAQAKPGVAVVSIRTWAGLTHSAAPPRCRACCFGRSRARWRCSAPASTTPSCAPVRHANVVQTLLDYMLYWSCIWWSGACATPLCAPVGRPVPVWCVHGR